MEWNLCRKKPTALVQGKEKSLVHFTSKASNMWLSLQVGLCSSVKPTPLTAPWDV